MGIQRRRGTRAALAVLAGAVLAAAACEADTDPLFVFADTDGGPVVSEIDLSPDTVRIEGIGQSVQMQAVALDAAGATVQGAVLRWRSSDITVATVTGQGLVTGVGAGLATVSVTSGSAEARVPVSVVAEPGGG